MFDYAPKLTQTQFFSTSYAQVKAQMACEIISLVQQKVKLLNTTTNSITSSGSSTTKVKHFFVLKMKFQSTPSTHFPKKKRLKILE
jgi:hypothetical protein